MIGTERAAGGFFSVRFSTTIRGAKYVPSVCYKMTGDIQATIEEMAKDSNALARIYPEEVRFVSGIAYPVRKKEPVKRASSSAPGPGEPVAPKPGKGRRGRKEFS